MNLTSTHTVLVLLISTFVLVLSANTTDASTFPPCSQAQIHANVPKSCDSNSSTASSLDQAQQCLCTNHDFMIAAAQAIYTECGCDELITTAKLIVSTCSQNDTTPPFSVDDIVSVGDGGQGDCEVGDDKSGGVSAVGWTVIGVVIAVVATIGTFGAWLCPRYRRDFAQKMHMTWYA